MDYTNYALLVLAFLIGATGLVGDKVAKPDGRSLPARILPPGWIFIALSICTLILGLYKEHNSFAGQIRKIYPEFPAIVKQETKLSESEWTRNMSYRVSLRFLVQSLYRSVQGENPKPADSLQDLLKIRV
ncbi:MAG: hypothetical protein CRU72_00270 [Candidatus Accumulibacter phosphatis]|nr:hypothetical protein [Candidatus Accumulibacter phosphatis]